MSEISLKAPTYILGFLRPEDLHSLPSDISGFSDKVGDMLANEKETIFYNRRVAKVVGNTKYLSDFGKKAKERYCSGKPETDFTETSKTWEKDGRIVCESHDCGETSCGGNGEVFYLTKEEIAKIIGEQPKKNQGISN